MLQEEERPPGDEAIICLFASRDCCRNRSAGMLQELSPVATVGRVAISPGNTNMDLVTRLGGSCGSACGRGKPLAQRGARQMGNTSSESEIWPI